MISICICNPLELECPEFQGRYLGICIPRVLVTQTFLQRPSVLIFGFSMPTAPIAVFTCSLVEMTNSTAIRVCVCVCERERERRENPFEGALNNRYSANGCELCVPKMDCTDGYISSDLYQSDDNLVQSFVYPERGVERRMEESRFIRINFLP